MTAPPGSYGAPRKDARRVALLPAPDDFMAWRNHARVLLNDGVAPEHIEWLVESASQTDLFAGIAARPVMPCAHAPAAVGPSAFRIDRTVLQLMKSALLHREPGRFGLCYRILWRSGREPNLARMSADADVIRLHELAKSVRRDIHKMHAFVRFRKIGEIEKAAGEARETYIAWFEPDHHITRAVGPFFRDRFTGMNWTIITPEARISWDGKNLTDGPGGAKSEVPQEDAVEEEWRRYYSSIFNPARVKPQAMKSEMPVKYWKNLPEAKLIVPLIRNADARVREMIAKQAAMSEPLTLGPAKTTPAMKPERFGSLDELNAFAGQHDQPPSDNFSNTLVFGEGPTDAPLMLIGEQPGDSEDKERRPFVGPAGELLDRAMEEAGLGRKQIYLTNAVKRFKFHQRGKRRLHRTPTQGEISHYRWWLMEEIALVKPRLVVPLGASAVLALTGQRQKLSMLAGQLLHLEGGPEMIAAYHPSYILRLPDEEGREIEYRKLVRHLAQAKEAVAA